MAARGTSSSSFSTAIWAPRTPPPQEPPRCTAAAAASEEEKLLRAVERGIERSYAAKRASSSCPSLWRQLVRKATKKRARAAAASTRHAPAPASPPRTRQELPEAPRTGAAASGSASKNPPEAAAAGEGGLPVGEAAVLARSGYAAAMKCAMARIEGGDVGGDGEAFAEMKQAMKGLMDVSFIKAKPPRIPMTFVSRWPRNNRGQLPNVIVDPIILASGHSIDKFSHRWSSGGTDQPLLTAPNHLLRDVITIWCLDHSIPLPPSTPSTSIDEAPPSEEEMPLLLQKLSMHSVKQQEALHKIHLLSRSSKGVKPCLGQWQELVPKLMGLHKNWRATWSKELEQERLATILNLSLHKPNREILARHKQLPDALKKTIQRANKFGSPLATMAKVAAAIAILSEIDVFREKVVGLGGILMLQEFLGTKDALVRNEASAAILALCTDDATVAIAELNHVPDALLDCLSDGVVGDECLLLLERISVGNFVPDWIADGVVYLMNAIIRHERGHLTSWGIQAAVCLIYNAIQRDAGRGRLMSAEKLADFVETLRNLEKMEMVPERVFQIEEILRIVSERLPD